MVPQLSEVRSPTVGPALDGVPSLREDSDEFISTCVLRDASASHDLGGDLWLSGGAAATVEPDVGLALLSEALVGNVDVAIVPHSVELFAVVLSGAEGSLIELVKLTVRVVVVVLRGHALLHDVPKTDSSNIIAGVDDAAFGARSSGVLAGHWQVGAVCVATIRIAFHNIGTILLVVVC